MFEEPVGGDRRDETYGARSGKVGLTRFGGHRIYVRILDGEGVASFTDTRGHVGITWTLQQAKSNSLAETVESSTL